MLPADANAEIHIVDHKALCGGSFFRVNEVARFLNGITTPPTPGMEVCLENAKTGPLDV